MQIFLNILFLILGLFFLIKGSDLFVDGASGIAKKMKISSFIIGVTVIAIGTSLPELSVSIISSIKGNSGVALGNIVGSNMFNMLFALGVISVVSPVIIKGNIKKLDMPILILITSCLLFFVSNKFITNNTENFLTCVEGCILLVLTILYMVITIIRGKKSKNSEEEITEEINENKPGIIQTEKKTFFNKIKSFKEKHSKSIWFLILNLVVGLAGVIFGGECVSATAEFLALKMGMSEMLVGVTIVAISTSLPELVVSLMAVHKNETDMALGNLIGSSILNIGLVLAIAVIIKDIVIPATVLINLGIMTAAVLIVSMFVFFGNKINRYSGAFLMVLYISYLVYSCLVIWFYK